jgi:hypothetical protein
VFVVWIAGDVCFLAADAISRTVFLLCRIATRRAVQFHELGKVNIHSERALDGFQIRLQSVTRDLNAVQQTTGQFVHKVLRGIAVAAADKP